MQDILFISMENWDEIWRRNQFFCAELSRRYPGLRILFVGQQRDVSHYIRRGDLASLMAMQGFATVPEFPGIALLRPLKFLPNSIAITRAFNDALIRMQIRSAMKRIGMQPRPILWLNPHYAVHMVGKMDEAAVVYDITDDWTLATLPPAENKLIREQDEELCRRADLVIVCSQALEDSRRSRCRNLLQLANGVDVDHYAPIAAESPDRLLAKRRSPVFGYTGTLHPDRIDTKIIVALSQAFPQGKVVLIGPNHLGEAANAELKAHPNIVLGGSVPYAKIAESMDQFDVCIVPHQESKFTESLNPIKLWEYLACGKPIVSSNVAGFRDFPALCRIATGPEAFVAACQSALAEDNALRNERRSVASHHSWKARVDRLVEALDALIYPKEAARSTVPAAALSEK